MELTGLILINPDLIQRTNGITIDRYPGSERPKSARTNANSAVVHDLICNQMTRPTPTRPPSDRKTNENITHFRTRS